MAHQPLKKESVIQMIINVNSCKLQTEGGRQFSGS